MYDATLEVVVVVGGDVIRCRDVEGVLLEAGAGILHVVPGDILAEIVVRPGAVQGASLCRKN